MLYQLSYARNRVFALRKRAVLLYVSYVRGHNAGQPDAIMPGAAHGQGAAVRHET